MSKNLPERRTNGKLRKKNREPYSFERGRRICEKIASSNLGLWTLYNTLDWFPSPSTVQKWALDHEDFREMYLMAKASQGHYFAEDQNLIADELETYVRKSSDHPAKLNAIVQAAKLKIESRRWSAARLAPKEFGEKLDSEVHVKHDTEGSLDTLAGELASLAVRGRQKRLSEGSD